MTITLEDFRGDWPLVFFYPADFTFVCPTELQAPAALEEQFHAAGTSILAASSDSGFSHRAWFETDPRLAGVHYPVVADQSRQLSSRFGVLQDDGTALRGSFLIDPDAWFSGPFRGRQRKPARRRGDSKSKKVSPTGTTLTAERENHVYSGHVTLTDSRRLAFSARPGYDRAPFAYELVAGRVIAASSSSTTAPTVALATQRRSAAPAATGRFTTSARRQKGHHISPAVATGLAQGSLR